MRDRLHEHDAPNPRHARVRESAPQPWKPRHPHTRSTCVISLLTVVFLTACAPRRPQPRGPHEQRSHDPQPCQTHRPRRSRAETRPDPPAPTYAFTNDAHVFWIGGAADKRPFMGRGPTHVMRRLMTRMEPDLPGHHHYFGYNDRDAILNSIRQSRRSDPNAPVVLIGHSFGGASAIRIARTLESENISVDLILTLDPVWPIPIAQPDAPRCWINVHQVSTALDYFAQIPLAGPPTAGVLSFLTCGLWGNMSDTIATAGRQLGRQTHATENIVVHLRHGAAPAMLTIGLDRYRQRTPTNPRDHAPRKSEPRPSGSGPSSEPHPSEPEPQA